MMCKLTNDERELVEKNHNLIYWYANSHNLDLNDYYDILAIALCKAAIGYDSSKGAFSTYATRCLENARLMEIRNNNCKSRQALVISFDTVISEKDGNTLTVEDTLTTGLDVLDECMLLDFEDLSSIQRQILYLAYIGKNQSEIADIVDRSQSVVSRHMVAAKKKILKGA